MILYNVTTNVDESIHEEWLDWMQKVHIPEVMKTGLFFEYKFLRLIEQPDLETPGITYAVQYFLKDIKDFLTYSENFAPALRKKTQDKYGDKMMSFRTLLEVVE